MDRNLILTSLAALVVAAQPAAAASSIDVQGELLLGQQPAARILVAQQNQNQEQNQNQNQPAPGQEQEQEQEQNQNQNQGGDGGNGDGGNGDDGDDGDDETPVLTREEASSLPNYVCFYVDADLKGNVFCSEVGGYSMELSDDWDNQISSIEIVGTVKVTVCTDDNYGDTCAEFTATAATLPEGLDDTISSWKAE